MDHLLGALKANNLALVQSALSHVTEEAREDPRILETAYRENVSGDILIFLIQRDILFLEKLVEEEEVFGDIWTNPPSTAPAWRWRKILSGIKFGRPEAAYPDGVTNLMISATTAPVDKETLIAFHRVTDRLLCLGEYLLLNPDVNQTDETGHTALDYARQQGPTEAIRLLQGDKIPIYDQRKDLRYLLNFTQVYKIIQLLGHGAYGQVSLALDNQGRKVALKKFAPDANYETEIALNLTLNDTTDPAWVKYIDHFTVMGLTEDNYLVMEYVEGTSIHKYSFSSKREVGLFLRELFRVLKKLDRLGLQHGDIHGENLMIDSTGQLRLIDWGEGCTNQQEGVVTSHDCQENVNFNYDGLKKLFVRSASFHDLAQEHPQDPLHAAWPRSDLVTYRKFYQALGQANNWTMKPLSDIQAFFQTYFPEVK